MNMDAYGSMSVDELPARTGPLTLLTRISLDEVDELDASHRFISSRRINAAATDNKTEVKSEPDFYFEGSHCSPSIFPASIHSLRSMIQSLSAILL